MPIFTAALQVICLPPPGCNLLVLLFTNILPIKMSNSNTGLDKIHKIQLKLAIRNDNFFFLKLPMKYFRSSCIDLIVISSSILNPMKSFSIMNLDSKDLLLWMVAT